MALLTPPASETREIRYISEQIEHLIAHQADAIASQEKFLSEVSRMNDDQQKKIEDLRAAINAVGKRVEELENEVHKWRGVKDVILWVLSTGVLIIFGIFELYRQF